jgi:aspartate oxidase
MTLQGAVLSLKTASDIAKGFLHLQSLAENQGKVIELNEAILSAQSSALTAQSEHFTMVQRVRDLEEEIARIKAWEEEKKRYQMVNPWQGSTFLVYALKESRKESEPPHWICTKCYDDGRRTILQPHLDKVGYWLLVCPTCHAEINSGIRGTHKPEYAPT